MAESCENIISKTGWGLCHYFLIGLCALCTLAEAAADVIVLTVIPLLACDLHFNKNDTIALNAVLSFGMAIGSLVFGIIADQTGRKNLIPISMVIIFCASISLSFSQTYFLISLAIFVLGIGAAGNNAIVRVYLIECLPAEKRGSCLAFIDLIFIIGFILTLGLSWSIVPSIIRMLNNEFRPSSWRVLVGLGGAPSLMMACAASLLPPSPRYLLYRLRMQQALAVLQQMFAINNSQHTDNFPPCNLNNCIRGDDTDTAVGHIFEIVKQFFLKIWQRIMLIWSPAFVKNTLLFIFIKLMLFPGFMWLALWRTHLTYQLVDKESLSSNQNCTTDIGDIVNNFLHNCHEINNFHFEYSLIYASFLVLGELYLTLGMNFVGKRISLASFGIIGATAIIGLIFAKRYDAQIVLSMFFLASYSIIYTTINISLLENYPTGVRGSIMGLTSVLPHIASFFIKFFTQATCTRSIYTMAGLLIGATIAAMPVPDLTNAPMQE